VPLPPSPVEFSTWQPLLQTLPTPRLLGGGRHSCLLWPACLFTVHVREGPSPTLQNSWSPALFAKYLFFSAACLLLSLFFSFFLGQGSFCLGGYADLSQGVCGSTVCCLFAHLVVCISQAG
jgi:hypothetical protein